MAESMAESTDVTESGYRRLQVGSQRASLDGEMLWVISSGVGNGLDPEAILQKDG